MLDLRFGVSGVLKLGGMVARGVEEVVVDMAGVEVGWRLGR